MPPEPSPSLVEILSDEIRRAGPIDFARFMERALYDPVHGYYVTGRGRPGPGGDFVTASDAGPHLGRAIARQIVEIDRTVGPFDPFDVVECGAGRGWLARDVVRALESVAPPVARRLRYRAVDRSESMRAEARRSAPACEVLAPDALEPGTLSGLALAVELFDALPVRRLHRTPTELVEVHVGLGPAGDLVEVEGAPYQEVPPVDPAALPGDTFEIAPTLAAVFAGMHAPFRRGVSLIVDYGDTAERLRRRFPRGTVLAYSRHRAHDDLLQRPGRQDLTAHVDFTALERAAAACGWQHLGTVSQERFLVASGILEAFEANDDGRWRDPRQVVARQQALTLLHPAGLGRAFRVAHFARGVGCPRLAAISGPA